MDSINIFDYGSKMVTSNILLFNIDFFIFLIGDSAVLITTDPVIKEIDLMYDNQYKDVLLHADTYADFYFGGNSSFYNISSNQVKKVEEYLGFNNTYEIKHINEDDITNKYFSFTMRDDNDEHVYYVSHFIIYHRNTITHL